MKFSIGYRTIKTAVGTAIAIFIAQQFGLDNFASAGILTILCIQVTKKRIFKDFLGSISCLCPCYAFFSPVF